MWNQREQIWFKDSVEIIKDNLTEERDKQKAIDLLNIVTKNTKQQLKLSIESRNALNLLLEDNNITAQQAYNYIINFNDTTNTRNEIVSGQNEITQNDIEKIKKVIDDVDLSTMDWVYLVTKVVSLWLMPITNNNQIKLSEWIKEWVKSTIKSAITWGTITNWNFNNPSLEKARFTILGYLNKKLESEVKRLELCLKFIQEWDLNNSNQITQRINFLILLYNNQDYQILIYIILYLLINELFQITI